MSNEVQRATPGTVPEREHRGTEANGAHGERQHRGGHRHRREPRPSVDLTDHKTCCDGSPQLLTAADGKFVALWEDPKLQPNICGVWGVAAGHKGSRRAMEDRHRIVYAKGSRGFFGVYDGHGGQEAVEVAQKRLHLLMRFGGGGTGEGEEKEPRSHANSAGPSPTLRPAATAAAAAAVAGAGGAAAGANANAAAAAAAGAGLAAENAGSPGAASPNAGSPQTTDRESALGEPKIASTTRGGDGQPPASGGVDAAPKPRRDSADNKTGPSGANNNNALLPANAAAAGTGAAALDAVTDLQPHSSDPPAAAGAGAAGGSPAAATTSSTGGRVRQLHEKKVGPAGGGGGGGSVATKRPRVQPGEPFRKEIEHAFAQCEDEILAYSRRHDTRDGTTAACVWIHGDTVYCANVGDSRTILCRADKAVPLSRDHKPQDEDERNRILAAGGEVRPVMKDRPAFCCFKAKKVPQGADRLWPGGFSVSRALGDIDYKDRNRGKVTVTGTLIARPDVTITTITKDDQFLVLATDGMWDVISNQDACDIVLKEVKKRKGDPGKIAEKLVNRAFQLGSEDNITALVVFFTHHRQFPHDQF